jgi:hypothetical protein
MRSVIFIAIFFLMVFCPFTQQSLADVNIGMSVGDEGLKSFYLAIGDYYHVPEKQIIIVRRQKLPEEEMPVVFFIAKRADVSPQVIIKMRLGGQSWWEISTHYGLRADAFYVPIKHDPGPPYGKAYGHYKHQKKNNWNKIVLTDADIVNFVNLRFISEHWGYSPDEVVRMREKGKNFININSAVKEKKSKSKANNYASEDDKDKSSNNKAKGKKK